MSLIKKCCFMLITLSMMLPAFPVIPALGAEDLPRVEHVYLESENGAVAGASVTVHAEYLNGASEADSTYKWYRADFADIAATDKQYGNSAEISGASDRIYTLTEDDVDKYIYCIITPRGGLPEISFSYGKVVASGSGAPSVDPASMRIWAKDTRIGAELYAHYTYQNPRGGAESGTKIVWQRSDKYDGGYYDISGATGDTYVLQPEDYGKFIRFHVTPSGGSTAEFDTEIEEPNSLKGNNNNKKFIYCTPENLLAFADASCSDMRYPIIKGKIQGGSDFLLDNLANMTWSSTTPNIYTFDSGRTIQWDKLVFVVNGMTQIEKLEVSDDGETYTDIGIQPYPFSQNKVSEFPLDEPVSGRYIRVTIAKDTNSYLREFQVYLQPESFSELFATSLDTAEFDRDEQTILNIPSGTTVAELKESMIGSTAAPTLEVLGYNGDAVEDDEVVLGGYTLRSVSANGKTETEYKLSNESELPNTIVKELSVTTSKDEALGIRVGFTLTGEYALESLNGGSGGNQADFQWYFSQEENGEYAPIAGANAKTYTVTANELNGYLKLEVSPQGGVARRSTALGPVRREISNIPAAPECESVTIRSEAEEVYANDVLTGEYVYFDANADEEDLTKTEKQWFRIGKDNKRVPIANAANDTYTLTAEDVECSIVYGVKPYAAVPPQPADFSYSKAVFVTKEPAQADYDALTLGNNLSNVTSNLVLPLKGKNGSDITWASDKPEVIGIDGVVRQQASEQKVTLTAMIKHPDRETVLTKEFKDITVPAKKTGGLSSGGSGGSGGSGSGNGNGGNHTVSAPSVPRPEITVPENVGQGDNDSSDEMFGITDITADDWAYPYVIDLMKKGVLSKPEDGKFNPKSSLKREESIKMLVELFDMTDESANCDFSDVNADAWSYKYIASAAAKGLINGIGNNAFGVGYEVTRQDFAVMTYNFMKAFGSEKAAVKEEVVFTDANGISDYAKEAVTYLVKGGVINGTPQGEFLPEASITREEAAKILSCLLAE